jgi:uncharacterized protein (DUF736 family)
MAEYSNENSGALFKNEKKDTDKHPDYAGKINVNGKELRLAAWVREGKAGKFMSLKVSELTQKQEVKPAAKASGSFEDMPDDLPF